MSQTELYIENELVELSDDVVMPITLWLSTIKDISKRTSSYSKSITIPGTKRNNELFAHAYDLQQTTQAGSTKKIFNGTVPNIGTSFNRKKLADFILMSNGATVLTGTAELNRVKEIDSVVRYEITLFGDLVNLVKVLADKDLTDLDSSELDHLFDISAISGSWNYELPYVYPIIDYGLVNTRMESITMNNFRPAVKASWYWDKIFEESNFTYSGSFFETDRWTKLILPYNKETSPSPEMFEEIQLQQTSEIAALNNDDLLFELGLNDPNNNWDAATQTLTANISGSYEFNSGLELIFGGQIDSTFLVQDDLIQNREFDIHVDLEINGTVTDSASATISQGQIYSKIVQSTGTSPQWQPRTQYTFTAFRRIDLEEGDEVRFIWRDTRESLPFRNVTQSTNIGNTLNILLRENQVMTVTPGSIEGSTVSGNTIIPTGMKQKDFVSGILKVFNLYAEPDKNVPRKINIKTRDDYYDTNVFRDWTQKVDHSKEITNEVLQGSNVRTIQLKWKRDPDDYFQNLYHRTWNREYGEKRIGTGYEFNNEIKDVLELPFSTAVPIQYSAGPLIGDTRIEMRTEDPTLGGGSELQHTTIRVAGLSQLLAEDPTETEPDLPKLERALIGRKVLIGEWDRTITDVISPWEFRIDSEIIPQNPVEINGLWYEFYNQVFRYIGYLPTLVVPAILESEDGGITRKPFDSQPRLLYYNGTVPVNSYTIMQTPYKPESSVRYFYNDSFPKSEEFSVFPFASHLMGDPPDEFTFDLLFEQPRQIYWSLDESAFSPHQPEPYTLFPHNTTATSSQLHMSLGNVSGYDYVAQWAFEYRLFESSDPWIQTTWINTSVDGVKLRTVSDLEPSTTYEYRSIARRLDDPDNIQISPNTIGFSTSAQQLPAPSFLARIYDESQCEIDLQWGSSSGATGYILQKSVGNGVYETIYTGSSTSYVDDVFNHPGSIGGDLILDYRVRATSTSAPDSDWTNAGTLTIIGYQTGPCTTF